MATKEELFAAVRLVHKHCVSVNGCCGCPLYDWCEEEYVYRYSPSPNQWPDPEEGGVKVEKNICFTYKYVSEYQECPAANDDIVFASNGDTIVRCKAYEETEGGGEADKKTNCSDCGNRNTPLCKYCEHDAEGGGADGN